MARARCPLDTKEHDFASTSQRFVKRRTIESIEDFLAVLLLENLTQFLSGSLCDTSFSVSLMLQFPNSLGRCKLRNVAIGYLASS